MQIDKLYKDALNEFKNKNYQKAIKKFNEVINLDNKHADSYANLAVINKIQKNYESSFNNLNKALSLNPKSANLHANMGNLLKVTNNYKAALSAYTNAIKLNPKDPNNHNNIGILYEKMNDQNKAIVAYKNAVKVDGNYSKAINNIGVILYKQKKYQEALDLFKIALGVDENYHELHSNMGACLNKLKKYPQAIVELNLAIKHMPKHGGAYTNLGNVYYKLDEYKKAIKNHEKSIQLEPNGANAHSNLANAFKQLGYTDKAIASYQKAIQLDGSFINAYFDLATTYLIKEDFLNGFKYYEKRFYKDEMKSHIIKYKDIYTRPLFTGKEDITNKILLVHSEQGYGDSIQFIRYACVLKQKYGCKVIISTRKELVELFKNLDEIDEVVYREDKTPPFDYQVALLSLPFVFKMKTSKDIPLEEPYLKANSKNENLTIKKQKGKFNIGINWSASVTGESYDGKVFDIKYLEPLMKHPKINVYTLQMGPEKKDIIDLGYEKDIIDLTKHIHSFDDTAYLISQLDLVISSDTSVAHLSGALNKEVWIPLQKMPDWRWGKKGINSIWYKSAKLFRQKTVRQWDSVFQSIFAKMSKQFKIKIK